MDFIYFDTFSGRLRFHKWCFKICNKGCANMEEFLRALSQVSEPTAKVRGDVLYSGANHSDPVYILEQGFSKIINAPVTERETIYRCAGPGNVLGYSVLNGESRTRSSALMLTAGVVREIPVATFEQMLQTDYRFWRWIAKQEAMRREALELRLEILGLADARQRMHALLPHLVREFGFPRQRDGSFLIPMKQSELASLAAVTRETASSTLNAMCREGLLRIFRGRLEVPDISALEHSLAMGAC